MSSFEFHLDPPAYWDDFCSRHHGSFYTTGWQQLLASSLGSRTIYMRSKTSEAASVITVFRAGPFNIGYMGFPIGTMLGGADFTEADIQLLRTAPLPLRVNALRLPVSGFRHFPALAFPGVSAPETEITSLATWDVEKLPKLRRNMRKAKQAPLELQDASDSELGGTLYRLYSDTLDRHGGHRRYNARYFRRLIELANDHSDLRCLTASIGGQVAGFLVTALHDDTGYYLHGGSDPAFREHRPSYLLLHEAITWAKSRAADRFSLMSSPPQQPSLVYFKEKWGGETRDHTTYTLPRNPLASKAFLTFERLYRMVR